jgi:lysophospholipase L1-like esterase
MQSADRQPRIVLLGASYAGGWNVPNVGNVPVANKGITGQQSFQLLDRFDADVVALRPRAVIIWGFINDIFRSDRQKIDATLQRTRDSVVAMVRKARAQGIEPILATEVTIRPPASWSETLASWVGWALGKESYQDRVNQRVLDVNRWLRETAAREGVLLLDLQPIVSDSSQIRRRQYATPDGSHLTPAAYEALTAYALPILEKHLATSDTPVHDR